jgi:hypothetical protein
MNVSPSEIPMSGSTGTSIYKDSNESKFIEFPRGIYLPDVGSYKNSSNER